MLQAIRRPTPLRPLVLCSTDKKYHHYRASSKLVTRDKLLNLKKDIQLKLKDKQEQAFQYCNAVKYNERDYYCMKLMHEIKLLNQRNVQIDLFLSVLDNNSAQESEETAL